MCRSGLLPDGPLEDRGIVIDGYAFSEAAGEARAVIADAMRIVELIAAHAHLSLEPAAALLLAGKQGAVRTRHFGAITIRDGITQEVGRGISLADDSHLAIQFLLYGSQQG